MSSHTPGPWHVAGDRGEWVMDKDNMTICRVNPAVMLTPSGKTMSGNKPHPGNAHLIAAAPELLEAAVYLLSHMDSHPDAGYTQETYDQAWDDLLNATDKAGGWSS